MAFYPEPWSYEDDADVEIAQEMWPMKAAEPAPAPPGNNYSSVFRRYWEKLLGR